jgi:2-methylisocitrate lyase-like PEP mutase family enzyme
VVGRGEAFARIQAAVDARNEGLDIVLLARTDALIISEEEALFRTKKFLEIGVDIVFIEALPDKAAMARAVQAVGGPVCANIIEGGKRENMSAAELAKLGFCTVAYPWTLVAAKLKSIRETLENIKASMTVGAPPKILSYEEVCYGVGFNKYWDLEERYQYEQEAPSKRV